MSSQVMLLLLVWTTLWPPLLYTNSFSQNFHTSSGTSTVTWQPSLPLPLTLAHSSFPPYPYDGWNRRRPLPQMSVCLPPSPASQPTLAEILLSAALNPFPCFSITYVAIWHSIYFPPLFFFLSRGISESIQRDILLMIRTLYSMWIKKIKTSGDHRLGLELSSEMKHTSVFINQFLFSLWTMYATILGFHCFH